MTEPVTVTPEESENAWHIWRDLCLLSDTAFLEAGEQPDDPESIKQSAIADAAVVGALSEEFARHRLTSIAKVADERDVLAAALQGLLHATCGETGFASAVRGAGAKAYPWPALDIAEEKARAALAKLGDKEQQT
jgi:hypothetical protein